LTPPARDGWDNVTAMAHFMDVLPAEQLVVPSSRRMPHRLMVTITILGVGMIACSSTESSPGTSGTDVNAYASATCERLQRCDLSFVKEYLGDSAACATRLAADFKGQLATPGTNLPQSQIDACAAKLKQAACDVESGTLTECQFKGTLAAGAPCATSAQCKSGACFKPLVGVIIADCGTCSDPVAAGADCSNAACQIGLACINDKCIELAGAGAACEAIKPCKSSFQCVSGKCEKPLPKDAECGLSDGALACDPAPALLCLPTGPGADAKGKCTEVQFAQLGATCGFDAATSTLVSCLGSSCAGVETGKCVPDLEEGAPCSDKPPACSYPLDCRNGKCTKADPMACR
jgi:hypothetical protein